MKSKRIVYFDENIQQKHMLVRDSQSKKNVSLSKGFREPSGNKSHRLQANRNSVSDKVTNSQKIKILLVKNGFIFQKKYLIYDIQCMLTKQEKGSNQQAQVQPSQEDQENQSITERPQQDCLFINFESNLFGVTKGSVRHNFCLDQENGNFLEVRFPGYVLDNIIITNKRIQYVNDGMDLEQYEVHMIEPIKLLQQSQLIRQEKIRKHIQASNSLQLERSPSKVKLQLYWNPQGQQSVEGNLVSKLGLKKGQQQSMTVNNNLLNFQQKESGRIKKHSNTTNEKRNRDNNIKFSFTQIMKYNKDTVTPSKGIKAKPASKKYLNDSGYGAPMNKMQRENNRRQDAYGLEELGKKLKVNQIEERLCDNIEQLKQIDPEPNRYGIYKKIN